MRQLALLLAISILAAGCGDDKSSGGGGGTTPGPVCLFAGEDCFQLSGTFTPTNLTDLQAACTGFGGTYTASSTCSTAATVAGYCNFTDVSTFTGVTVPGATARGYYYTATYDATTAGVACAGDGGTWVAGGGGGGTTIRCLLAGGICSQLTGAMTAADLTSLSGQCTGSGGTYAASACSTASTVPGYCSDSMTAPVSGVTLAQADYYYTPAWNPTTATADCFGTWVGGAAQVCGDGSVTGTEVCDGVNLNGQSCSTQGFTGGTLTCNAGCLTFNTSACTGSSFNPTNASESEANGAIGTADGPYTTDHLISAAITPAGDLDYFAIQNTTGSPVTVRLETSTGSVGSCSADTTITVVNSGGTQVGYNDDLGVGSCSLLSISIPASTTYYAYVEEYWGATIASYLLQVDFP